MANLLTPARHWWGAIFLFLSVFGWCQNLPEIRWLIDDQPPQFILTGPDQGKGSVDGILRFFQERLPEFNHTVVVANIQRSLALLQTDGPYVGVGYVKTPEREKVVLFSQAFSVVLPPGLLVRRADLEKIRPFVLPDGGIDLDPLLNAGVLRVGVAAGRSYGPAVDAVLARYQNSTVVVTRFTASGIMAGLVQMLDQGRVDAIFAFRSEVRYVIRDESQLANLVVLPVMPTGRPLTIHAVVPKTDWGRSFLAQIDPLIVKARGDPAFRAFADRWTDDESRAAVARFLKSLD